MIWDDLNWKHTVEHHGSQKTKPSRFPLLRMTFCLDLFGILIFSCWLIGPYWRGSCISGVFFLSAFLTFTTIISRSTRRLLFYQKFFHRMDSNYFHGSVEYQLIH
jgi:hypothetical protein